MYHACSRHRTVHPLLPLAIVAAFFASLLVQASLASVADASFTGEVQIQNIVEAKKGEKPVYREYRGISLGMGMEMARQKLGEPKDKSDRQDFYSFSDKEEASVYYDEQKVVSAISVMYTGAENAPSAKDILGADVPPNESGMIYKMIRYPDFGCWISYTKLPGDTPRVVIALQRM